MFYRPDFRCDDRDPLQQELNRLYDYASDLETKVLHRSRLNLFHGLMLELLSSHRLHRLGRALDIGCNAGGYSRMLSDFGFGEVEGIDIEPELVERATRAFASEKPGAAIRFRVENAEELSATAAYDFILCTEVIEHTAQPRRVVENLCRALAPGGVAVVTLPNACSLPFAKAALKYRLLRRHDDPVFEDHLRYPFWKARGLFAGRELRLVGTTGTNLVFDATVLRLIYRTPLFAPLNRLQFELARRWPFKYFAQFFFMVWQRPA
ncbi:MAG: class I SAM-dependent methyltransferase [Candidatus Eisenbacteria bacterium]